MKAKILIVDDEPSIRETLEAFLADVGHEVSTARSYDEALLLIEAAAYDLVIADILLGGRTGVDLLRACRELKKSCVVVIITGAPTIDTAAEAVRLGAFDYLPKPVIKDGVLKVTDAALRYKAMADTAESYRANLESIFRSVNDAIITVDRSMTVIQANDAAGKICAIGRDTVGRPLTIVASHCCARCLPAVVETLETQKPVELSRVECGHDTAGGQVVTVTASPLVDNSGAVGGAVLVIRDETRLADLERDLGERRVFHNIVGKSDTMQALYALIEKLADVQSTALITGESGTGKELVAAAIHYAGGRADRPFVKVNCTALPENLLESELFGHVRGSFTGAVRDTVGRFAMADGGTIFLDEVGDMSTAMQARLLRVLQEREFERVGDSRTVKVDVRVIAATNRDLAARVKEGEFRQDLYYRLKVVELRLPPLRDRREDIPLLVDHFIARFNKKMRRDVSSVSGDVLKLFMEYRWPGNVRELEHALEHAFILCRQQVIIVEHLPPEIRTLVPAQPQPKDDGGEEYRSAILRALQRAGGNKVKAAAILGISRRTLYRKIEEYHIEDAAT